MIVLLYMQMYSNFKQLFGFDGPLQSPNTNFNLKNKKTMNIN